jgi:hypothetical protein
MQKKKKNKKNLLNRVRAAGERAWARRRKAPHATRKKNKKNLLNRVRAAGERAGRVAERHRMLREKKEEEKK